MFQFTMVVLCRSMLESIDTSLPDHLKTMIIAEELLQLPMIILCQPAPLNTCMQGNDKQNSPTGPAPEPTNWYQMDRMSALHAPWASRGPPVGLPRHTFSLDFRLVVPRPSIQDHIKTVIIAKACINF